MKKNMFMISLVFVLIFFISFSYANMIVEQAPGIDFSEPAELSYDDVLISSISKVHVYSCHNSFVDITIDNRFSRDLYVNIKNSNRFYYVDSENFFVRAGERQVIRAWVRAPCSAQGNYRNNMDFVISYNDQEIRKRISQEIFIEKSNNLKINIPKTQINTDPGVPVRYSLIVENTGPFNEIYELKLDSFRNDLTIVPARFSLNSKETQEVIIHGTFSPEIFGLKKISVSAIAEKNNLVAKFDLFANISRNYNFSLSGPEIIKVCQDSEGIVVNYQIENLAEVENSYKFRLSSPRFSYLHGNQISLNKGSLGIVPLIVYPESRQGLFSRDYVGNYTLQLIAESEYGKLLAVKDIDLFVERCYNVDISINLTDENVCRDDQPLVLDVLNSGKFKENIILNLESNLRDTEIGNVVLEKSNISVSAEESKQVLLYLNYLDDINITSGRFKVNIESYLESNPKIKDVLELNFYKETDVGCYELSVSPKRVFIETYENATEYKQIIELENVGIRYAEYDLSVFGDIEPLNLNTSLVGLGPNEKTFAELSLGSNYSGKQIIFVDAYYEGLTFRNPVTVYYDRPNLWLVWMSLAILILLIILILLVLAVVKKKPKNKKEVVRKQKVKPLKELKEKKKRNFKWLFILLGILFILFLLFGLWFISQRDFDEEIPLNETIKDEPVDEEIVDVEISEPILSKFWQRVKDFFSFKEVEKVPINETEIDDIEDVEEEPVFVDEDDTEERDSFLKRIYNYFVREKEIEEVKHPCPEVADMIFYIEENNLTGSFDYQIIPYNSRIKIDLSEVFIDPDGEEMTFSSSEAENISITHEGNITTITPERNFCGISTTRFYAEDPHGGVGQSPEINLIVLPPKDSNLINLILILLLIIACITIAGSILFFNDSK